MTIWSPFSVCGGATCGDAWFVDSGVVCRVGSPDGVCYAKSEGSVVLEGGLLLALHIRAGPLGVRVNK